MKSVLARSAALAAGLTLSLLVAACETDSPPPPPPPPPPPAMSLSSSVVQAAAAYQGYVRRASALQPTFTEGTAVQTSLQTAGAYEPRQLARGAVAYAAIVALQEPTFVQGVRAFAADPNGRNQIINQIFSDPAYAAQLPGAAAAAGLIVDRLKADGDALHKAGSAIKQSAYDIQRQSWSKEYIPNREGRLALAKQLSTSPALASTDDSAQLMQAALSGQGLGITPATAQPPYTQAVVRGMAVAALAVLGAAGDSNDAQVQALLDESTGPYCLNLSKLNLYQCLAVSKPHYEDVFCLGQHVLMDTGRCVQKVAGVAPPEDRLVDRMMAARDAASGGKDASAIGVPYNDMNKKPARKSAKKKSK